MQSNKISPLFTNKDYLSKIKILIKKDDIVTAIKYYQKVIKIEPKQTLKFYRELGNTLLKQGAVSEGIQILTSAIEKFPDRAGGYISLGHALLQQGSIEQAIKNYDRAIAINSDLQPQIKERLGNKFLELKQYEQAKIIFQELLQKHSNNPQGYEGLAKIAQMTYEWESVIKWLDISIHRTKAKSSYIKKSQFLIHRGQYQEGLEVINSYIAKEGEDPQILKTKASLYILVSRFQEAIDILQDLQDQITDNLSIKKLLVKALIGENKLYEASKVIEDLSSSSTEIKKNLYLILVEFVTQKNLDTSLQELRQLNDIRNNVTEQESRKLINYAIYNLEYKISNLSEFSQYHYKIISLGCRCMSRLIPTRWGLKMTKRTGELTHPFDIAVHPYDTVCKLIQNDFEDYLNPLLFTVNEKRIPIHKKYQIIFKHEIDNYFIINNYIELIKTYKKRIDNFYNDIANYPILFLHFNDPQQKTNIFPLKLALILQEKFPNIQHKLLCISTAESAYIPNKSELPGNLIFKYIPYPCKEYWWYEPEYYTSEPGKNFEVSIINAIKKIIINYFS